MGKRQKLRAQLETFERDYGLLLIEEIELELAGGLPGYLGEKVTPGFASTPHGRRAWQERAESLASLEHKIISLRASLGEDAEAPPLALLHAYVADLRTDGDPNLAIATRPRHFSRSFEN